MKKSSRLSELSVRMKGVEPPRLTALDPKSSASTNSATSAKIRPQRYYFLLVEIKISSIFA